MSDRTPERLTLHLLARIEGLTYQSDEVIDSLDDLSSILGDDGVPAKLDRELRIVRTERIARLGGTPTTARSMPFTSDAMVGSSSA